MPSDVLAHEQRQSALDVEITIEYPRGDSTPVSIRLGGEQSFQGSLLQDRLPADDTTDPCTIGAALFEALFGDAPLAQAWARASQSPERRIRLRIDPPGLRGLPWELLYDPQRRTFLAAGPATPFSRSLPVDRPLAEALPTRTLRVLVAVAAPMDLPDDLTPIDRKAEIAALLDMEKSLPTGVLKIEELPEPVTRAVLAQALLAGPQALHLIAHGVHQPGQDRTVIYLEDDRCQAAPVPVDEFARLFAPRQGEGPVLVILGACGSAAVPLVEAGVPAVIAMRESIRGKAVQDVAKEFYRRLTFHGVVDRALNEARHVLRAARDPAAGIPVLTMHIRDGRLLAAQPVSMSSPVRMGVWPGQPDHFTGRDDEVKAVIDGLEPGHAVSLCGPGGIGKTAIALEVARRLAPGDAASFAFPDGVVFHSFYTQSAIAAAAETIVRGFVPGADDVSLRALGGLLASRRALLIFDGAEDADDLHALLEVTGGCAVLVTTRNRLQAPGVRIDVPQLPLDEAVDLLRLWGGDYLAREEAAPYLETVAKQLGQLPVALCIAGTYLGVTEEPLCEYLPWLEANPVAAASDYDSTHRQENVDVLLERSLAQVGDDACRVLSAAGVLALDAIDTPFIAGALGMDGAVQREALRKLLGYGLMVRDASGRVRIFHALIHAYARAKLPPADDVLAALVTAYIGRIEAESAQGPEGYHRLDADRPHALRLLEGCLERGQPRLALYLAGALADYLDVQGHAQAFLRTQQAGLSVVREIGDRGGEGTVLGNLGSAYSDLGRVEEAIEYYEQALSIAREIGDRGEERRHLGNLGIAYAALGRHQEALSAYGYALELDPQDANAHYNSACAYGLMADVTKACDWLGRAIALDAKYRDMARSDSDFDRVRDALCFRALMEEA